MINCWDVNARGLAISRLVIIPVEVILMDSLGELHHFYQLLVKYLLTLCSLENTSLAPYFLWNTFLAPYFLWNGWLVPL